MSLLDEIKNYPVGAKLDIATSQYVHSATAPGAEFDIYSNAPAVRGLIKRGILKGECRWRYYEVEVLDHGEQGGE